MGLALVVKLNCLFLTVETKLPCLLAVYNYWRIGIAGHYLKGLEMYISSFNTRFSPYRIFFLDRDQEDRRMCRQLAMVIHHINFTDLITFPVL